MLKLDFSIESSDNRNKFVSDFFEKNPDYKPTAHELETITNYILYGKDADGTSIVDRKEVQIDTKYGSYSKRKAESLDELMDTPGFNENTICEKYIYRKGKAYIDKEKDGDIPGMTELWAGIARIEEILEKYGDGGEAAESANVSANDISTDNKCPYTKTQLYQLKHHLIDMRKQQYVLKDSHKQVEHTYNVNVHKGGMLYTAPMINWELYSFFPLGLYTGDVSRFTSPRSYVNKVSKWDVYSKIEDMPKHTIDFTNSEHIYMLIKSYQDLYMQMERDVESTAGALINTLDFYGKLCELSDERRYIYEQKKKGVENEIIRQKLIEKFNVTHSANYISTIFKQNICVDIAAAARLHADYFLNRDNPEMWKKCSCCGEFKLLDVREYMRKQRSSDGYASRCKKCDKEARAKRKSLKEG